MSWRLARKTRACYVSLWHLGKRRRRALTSAAPLKLGLIGDTTNLAHAAAHYKGAAPTAPRLVMLDEAFAGIDPTMRAQCLGVLAQFDFDVVMTSELEWGCYSTVPALAIYHLTTLPGLDAVAATRWLWNGREKRQLDHPEPLVAPPAPADAPSVTDLLSNPPVP